MKCRQNGELCDGRRAFARDRIFAPAAHNGNFLYEATILGRVYGLPVCAALTPDGEMYSHANGMGFSFTLGAAW